ncbi:MAG: GNAT family N-acetyltransferase [Anaerolineae bacterium]|nr:GNAT family N-acetyltransferase [Anaerolineae bacterium]
MPVLETQRLLVRPMTMDDLLPMHVAMNAGFGEDPLEERREWLEWTVRNYVALARLWQPPYGERAVVLKATGAFVGAVGFAQALGPYQRLTTFRQHGETDDLFMQPEFGLFWVTVPEHQRKGYAAEAAQALVDYGFKQMNLRRIIATTEYDNVGSQAVMRKLGMTLEQNPTPDNPPWFQVVGVLYNPAIKEES